MRLPLCFALLAVLVRLSPAAGAQETADRAPRADFQAVLHDNGPLVNSPGTGAGGADESVLRSPLNVLGFNHNYAGPTYRLADDFVVPAGGWTLTDVVFYAYQEGSPTTSTLTSYVLRLWDGPPGEPASTVLFGDLTTNRLDNSVFSNIYRRDRKDPPGAAYAPVMRSTVNAEWSLRPGTYWVEWGATGSMGPNVWAPPISINGQTDTGNALQFVDGQWRPAQDQLYEQGFPFQILGTAGAGPFLAAGPTALVYDVQVGASDTRTVTLTSNGSAPITIASITVSGDAAFAVDLGGTDLTLAPGESTAFTVTFAPTAVGPATGAVSIVSNDPASPQTVALSGVGTTFVTYASTDTPLVVPDCSGFPCQIPGVVTSTLTVPPGAGRLQDLDLDLDLPHDGVGNIIATLAHGATSVTVVDRPGVPASSGGCLSNNFNLVLDDEGTAGLVETACIGRSSLFEAYTADGHYVPNAPLSAFDAMDADGTWTLTVSDNELFDHGTLDAWALLVTTEQGVAGEGSPAPAVRLMVSPNPAAGAAQLALTVASAQTVRVALYDVLGREAVVIFDGPLAPGQTAYLRADVSALAPGLYVARARGGAVATAATFVVAR